MKATSVASLMICLAVGRIKLIQMPNTESKEFLLGELRKVEDWEADQKDLWFWEKLGRLPFVILDKLTPKFLREKIGQAVDEVGSYLQSGGRYLIREEAMVSKFPHAPLTVGDIALFPLQEMDRVAEELKQSRTKFAAIQGATTGIGGIFTLAIDIPALLGLSLKTLQEIAISYGYDPKEKSERIFIVKCMQFVSSDIVGKKAILEDLATFKQNERDTQAFSQLQGWQEVMVTYRDNFGWKKLFQMIPIAGILFGAYLNKSTIQEMAEAGKMLYRKRRILEKLQSFSLS